MDKHFGSTYLDRSTVAQVSNDENGITLVAEPLSTDADYNWWLFLDEINYAVWDPSVEGGTFEIVDQDGTVRWKINTDSVKENTVSFGIDGIRVGQNGYLVASVANSPIKQASISISIKAHRTRRKEFYG